MTLTEQQIDFIADDLENRGLTLDDLRAELVDHVCCMVEEEMETKEATFDEAYASALSAFESYNFKEIQEATIFFLLSKSSISMKKVVLMTSLLLVMLIYGANAVEQIAILDPPSISPISNGKTVITSGFGWRIHPIKKVKKMHKGCDFKAPMGTPVVATASGTIEIVAHHPKGHGKFIKIKHDENYQTLYANLSEFNVKEGDEVKQGDIIGYSGNSGLSTAPHLHYEVYKDGKVVNPEDYFDAKPMKD